MYRPLKPYFSVDASLLGEQNQPAVDIGAINLNILLNSRNDIAPGLFKHLASLKNEYIISVSASLLEHADHLEVLSAQLYLLAVMNRSPRAQKLVPVFSAPGQDVSLFTSNLHEYFSQQGLTEVKFPVFNFPGSGLQTIEECSLVVVPGQPANVLKEISTDHSEVTTVIIACPERTNSWPAVVELWDEFTERHGRLNTDITHSYIEKEEFETEKELWKKRTLLYQDFLSLSKKVQEKEYYEVINWYQKEYEILPTWYKRFGHIIKVMIGKRRFRSLFSDKVKKEKE